MGTNRWLPIGGLVTVLVVLGGAVAACQVLSRPALNHETQRRTYNQEISQIVFSDMASDDIVVRGRPSGTGVAVERRLSWNDEEPAIREVWQGDTLTINVDCPRSVPGRECSADYIVDLPANVSVDADVTSGDITLEGMAGGAHLRATSGDVTVHGLSGDSLDVQVTSGDLALDGLSVTTLKATATTGDVGAAFSAAPHGVDATTTSGDVKITVPRSDMAYKVQMRTSSGDATSDIGNTESGTGTISVRATSGDVAIRLA